MISALQREIKSNTDSLESSLSKLDTALKESSRCSASFGESSNSRGKVVCDKNKPYCVDGECMTRDIADTEEKCDVLDSRLHKLGHNYSSCWKEDESRCSVRYRSGDNTYEMRFYTSIPDTDDGLESYRSFDDFMSRCRHKDKNKHDGNNCETVYFGVDRNNKSTGKIFEDSRMNVGMYPDAVRNSASMWSLLPENDKCPPRK